jgi:hypothetical protein
MSVNYTKVTRFDIRTSLVGVEIWLGLFFYFNPVPIRSGNPKFYMLFEVYDSCMSFSNTCKPNDSTGRWALAVKTSRGSSIL